MIYRLKLILFLIIVFHLNADPQVESELLFDGTTINAVQSYGDDVWIATYGNGIYKYSKSLDKWTIYSTKNKNLENDFYYTLAVSRDFVWAGSSDGLFIYDIRRDQWRKRKFAVGGELGNWIRALCYDEKENVLWIGRFKNITKLDVARQRFGDYDLTLNNDTKTNNYKAIKADDQGYVWFGTEAGVHIYDKSKAVEDNSAWQFYSSQRGYFNGEGDAVSVADILFEGSNVWFGLDEFITIEKPNFNVGGIYRFNRRARWDRIDRRSGLPANGIYALERTGNTLWASVYSFDKKEKKEYGKGLALINRLSGKVTPVDLSITGIKSSAILTLHFDGEYMWLGTDAGLLRLRINNPLAGWGKHPHQG